MNNTETAALVRQMREALELIVQWDDAGLSLVDHLIEGAKASIAAADQWLAQYHGVLVFVDDRPRSTGDDLYRWAVDAEDWLRILHAEIELIRERDSMRPELNPQPLTDAEVNRAAFDAGFSTGLIVSDGGAFGRLVRIVERAHGIIQHTEGDKA